MRQAYEAIRVIRLQSRRAIVEVSAILQGRMPAENAALHGDIDTSPIHVADLRIHVEQLRMHPCLTRSNRFPFRRVHTQTPAQVHRNVMMLKIDNHFSIP
jgi:hypothetical protein